jgi:hypothetical protein
MMGIQGSVKISIEKWSLLFIAEVLFCTDLYIKTGTKLAAYADYGPQSMMLIPLYSSR